ncbi:Membrane-bound lytic murein transglycosylase B precursor [Pseudoruegeria aquimaris]|uniref:Membrane-bound lytic murein transglycosylase B n=1 Tax=Pseudoruegeria aquimaris TaxID=393663 RepID=A0A1Y5S2P9_9RHOB|nr:Membrane-bound lytic murein transglycosylase B precursor [Pseudoruegeria aquimaris]
MPISRVSAALLGASLCLTGPAAFAASGAVESSLRPVQRAVQSHSDTGLERSLRPTARGEIVLAQAHTSNLAFQRWIQSFYGRAQAQGISRATLDRAFKGVEYNTSVIAKDRNQSEFTKQIWDYLDSAASPTRVKNGKAALRKYDRTLKKIEATYGVDRDVVVAIWGLESAYGEHRGDLPVIESLATLAFDGRRGKFFESQLIAALKIIQSGDTSPRNMKGSWAGAMGHTQFIPTSYLAFAVDFTGDGKRDIWSDDPTDALASTAAYLKRSGWIKGQPWGKEVRLPRGFNYGLANRKTLKMPSDWAKLGVVGVDGKPVPNYGSASILLPAGASGAAFMIFKNFSVIERYNKADAYVIGVGHLSDRITGGPEIQASWPRGYQPLSFNEKKEMQRRLRRAGFLNDKIDGIIGPNTVNAIRAYQSSIGITPDGYPSKELMKYLR